MPRPTFNKGLVGPDIDAMRHAETVARFAGCPLGWFSTVTPSRQIPDAERPALFNDINNREWKFLSGRGKGYPHYALRVREHPRFDEHLVGLHQHSNFWLPKNLAPEDLMLALGFGRADYKWQGDKWVGENSRVNVALQANEGTFGIISRVAYMGKERGTQFHWGLKKKGRLEKSVEEGGEFWEWEQTREILNPRRSQSKGLRDLIAADATEQERRPRLHLGARLQPPTVTATCEPIKQTNFTTIIVKENLFDWLPDMHAPERLNAPPRHRDKIAPAPMLRLFAVLGNVDIIEAMRSVGPTHKAIAERIGISRSQATNIINSQFRPSRAVVRRVLEMARAA